MSVLNNDTWVLVADAEKALFLVNRLDADKPVLEVLDKETQDNPSDLAQSANRPGRRADDGPGQRSAMDDTDWHELAKDRFAADLADMLYERAHAGDFARLVVVAPPGVLGELRQHLHQEVQERIVAEVAKDLTNHPLDAMEKLLRTELEKA